MDRWVNADQVVGNTARPEARDGVEDGGCGLSGVDGAASRVHGSDVGVVGSQPVPGGFRGAPAGVDQVPGPVPLASSGGFPRHGSRCPAGRKVRLQTRQCSSGSIATGSIAVVGRKRGDPMAAPCAVFARDCSEPAETAAKRGCVHNGRTPAPRTGSVSRLHPQLVPAVVVQVLAVPADPAVLR